MSFGSSADQSDQAMVFTFFSYVSWNRKYKITSCRSLNHPDIQKRELKFRKCVSDETDAQRLFIIIFFFLHEKSHYLEIMKVYADVSCHIFFKKKFYCFGN